VWLCSITSPEKKTFKIKKTHPKRGFSAEDEISKGGKKATEKGNQTTQQISRFEEGQGEKTSKGQAKNTTTGNKCATQGGAWGS